MHESEEVHTLRIRGLPSKMAARAIGDVLADDSAVLGVRVVSTMESKLADDTVVVQVEERGLDRVCRKLLTGFAELEIEEMKSGRKVERTSR